MNNPVAWGNSVSRSFVGLLIDNCGSLGVNPNHLMACMAFETGRTFSPAIKNAAGSGAVGLIQFMPQTAAALGTTTDKLEIMTPECQLAYVYAYFKPSRYRLKTLSDVYMAILWPAAIGKPEDFILFDREDVSHPKRYIQNEGLDFNHDGKITKAEASKRVAALLDEGMTAPHFGMGK